MTTRRTALMALAGAAAPAAATDPDWAQWRGPKRDGLSVETGLLKEWPSGGPKQVWSVEGLGAGYGAVAVAGNRIYVQGSLSSRSSVHALDRATGKLLWTVPLGPAGDNDRGDGPRSTPTVEGQQLWVMTETGDLACLKAADGGVVWRKNALTDFKGRNPHWLLSESPLVDGERLIFTRSEGVV